MPWTSKKYVAVYTFLKCFLVFYILTAACAFDFGAIHIVNCVIYGTIIT